MVEKNEVKKIMCITLTLLFIHLFKRAWKNGRMKLKIFIFG